MDETAAEQANEWYAGRCVEIRKKVEMIQEWQRDHCKNCARQHKDHYFTREELAKLADVNQDTMDKLMEWLPGKGHMKYHAIPKGSVAIPIHVHEIEVESGADYEPLLPSLVTIDGIKGNPFKRYAMVTPDTIYYCPCGEVSVTETSGGRKHFQNCMQMKERQQAVKNKQLSASGGETIGGVTVRFVPVKDRNLELRSVMEQEMFSTRRRLLDTVLSDPRETASCVR